MKSKLKTIAYPNIGDGISHPYKGNKTRFFKLLVRDGSFSLMKVELLAESEADALKYGRARWPDSAVELAK